MKINPLLYTLPVLFLSSCFKGDNATTTDSANDAAGTGSPYLARKVVGVDMLTTDTDYDKPCNVLGEEYVRTTFNLGATTEMMELDYPNGCTFEWGGNKVSLAFGGKKPYPSIYQAEYIFNKSFQDATGHQPGQEIATDRHMAISGPAPEGTGSEHANTTPEGSESADVDADATADNDSSNSVSGVTSAAVQLTKPAVTTGRFMAVPGVGDKAVWEPAKGIMHVLYNNHIINVAVGTKDAPALRKKRAESLAEVLIDKIADGESTL
ncbi:hypothetical protein [Spirosoma utsteinense]|uniref:DUF3558 domain-containing protein n=1 Tax=Spirosoma utsteinense TaxID=2585773 RepID=A0ABR6W756_9BACT|nr:hypothetical protein [Spirosoma utsteinense]MBC3785877.1 hypothetical protein [Spirosoma utsteinense]MBC3792049.1 hypothetical protein [Spirosoma utsteinense]